MVKRQRSYDLMLNSVCKNFPDIPRDAVTLQTDNLNICYGHRADIAAEAWADVIDLLTVVEVVNQKEVNQKVWRAKDNTVERSASALQSWASLAASTTHNLK